MSATRSTAEAMGVLEASRRVLIDYGRYVATEICRARGTVHSRAVRDAMAAVGVLKPGWGGRDLWLGAVFKADDFEWTGAFHAYSDETRNIHERTIKVWRLKPNAHGFPRPADSPPFRAQGPKQIELF